MKEAGRRNIHLQSFWIYILIKLGDVWSYLFVWGMVVVRLLAWYLQLQSISQNSSEKKLLKFHNNIQDLFSRKMFNSLPYSVQVCFQITRWKVAIEKLWLWKVFIASYNLSYIVTKDIFSIRLLQNKLYYDMNILSCHVRLVDNHNNVNTGM